ncbi:MAG TPA: 50S ribosomal protein L23 [Firmicutes bacterium]|nr:50S ribosomal protein L23 [Bacillota bacterium]
METYRILVRPLVTEKSNLGPQDGKYTFVVNRNATKDQIKRAVEERFKVNVVTVNTANFEGKSKSRGYRSKGKKPDWKKAIVTLAKGETIPELYEDLG